MSSLDGLLTWRESSTSGEAIRAAIEAAARAPAALGLLERATRLVVTGAGSSYYVAQVAAAAARQVLLRPAVAVPLSELILRPGDGFLDRDHDIAVREPVIIISRSGFTTEAIEVARRMHTAGHPTITVTCRPASPLASLGDETLVSPLGDESGIVMTRSFASMLALLLAVIARVGADRLLAADLDRLPERWTESQAAADMGRQLGEVSWSRVVILGGGAAKGIADEWDLKLTETSQVPASAYEPLEFRHGPISVCEEGMLVVGIVGGAGAAEERVVVEEAGRLGATTWLIGQDGSGTGGGVDNLSFLGTDLHPLARLPLLAHPAHALALQLALTRGRDPDLPRHLGQVVLLRET